MYIHVSKTDCISMETETVHNHIMLISSVNKTICSFDLLSSWNIDLLNVNTL